VIALRLFGLSITKAAPSSQLSTISTPFWNSGWLRNWLSNFIQEPFTGAWQKNVEVRLENVLTFPAVYACIDLIAGDIGKLCLNLKEEIDDDVWEKIKVSAFSPVLRRPNRYQITQKFIEQWITSKLIYGNTYVLKERDDSNVVRALYVLDACRTTVLEAPDGSVFYRVAKSALAGIEESDVRIPASEIIHDVGFAPYHPLCGVSPISASGLAAVQGLNIQANSAKFFLNGSAPSGIITVPGDINDDQARQFKDHWEQNYSGSNVGKVAVLGGGMDYKPMMISAHDSQLIEQLKWSAETVCMTFHVPPYKIGIGGTPPYGNIEAVNQDYYATCLQKLIESIERLLDDGLGLTKIVGKTYGTEFDLDDLLRMDTATQYKTYGEGVIKGLLAPNEGRRKLGMKKVVGGESPMIQQQNYSLEAIAKRDAKDDPFSTASSTKTPQAEPGKADDGEDTPAPEEAAKHHRIEVYAALKKALQHASAA
jgi:HK97 family phage portal protein